MYSCTVALRVHVQQEKNAIQRFFWFDPANLAFPLHTHTPQPSYYVRVLPGLKLRSFERGTRGSSRAAGVAGASRTPTSYAKDLLETPRCVDPCKNIAPLAVMITT